MIQVNLLPAELRKREGAPVRRLAALAMGALLVSSSLMLVLTVHFGVLQKAQSTHEQMEGTLATLAPEAKYADALTREKAEYKKRNDTIQKISASRLLLTKKLDQLFDIIDYGEKSDRHFVWLTDLKVSPPRGASRGKDKDGGTLDFKGYSATEALDKFSDFHKDLKESPFFDDFLGIDDPSGRVVTFKEDVAPKKAWDFQLTMNLKAAEDRQRGDAAPASARRNRPANAQER
jgi:hypothetical protein